MPPPPNKYVRRFACKPCGVTWGIGLVVRNAPRQPTRCWVCGELRDQIENHPFGYGTPSGTTAYEWTCSASQAPYLVEDTVFGPVPREDVEEHDDGSPDAA